MSIEIANESGVAVDESSIVAAARFALDRMRVSRLAELSVLLVGLDEMAALTGLRTASIDDLADHLRKDADTIGVRANRADLAPEVRAVLAVGGDVDRAPAERVLVAREAPRGACGDGRGRERVGERCEGHVRARERREVHRVRLERGVVRAVLEVEPGEGRVA